MKTTSESASTSEPGIPDVPDIVAYPEEAVRRYRAAGFWSDRTVAQEFRAVADKYPDHAAVLTPDARLTYAELDRRTDRIAIGLRDLGLRPGDPVLLQVTNNLWTVLAWYGLLKAGLVPVATLAQHRRHEIVEIARQAEPVAHLIEPGFRSHDLVALAAEVAREQPSLRWLLTIGTASPPPGAVALETLEAVGRPDDPAVARAVVEEIQKAIPADSLAVFQLSGGTTSIPKLIPRLHAEYWYNSRAYAEAIDMDSTSCFAHLLPLVHNAGIVCGLHSAHSVGGCFALASPEPDQLKSIAGHITHTMMSPPLTSMVTKEPGLLESLDALRVFIWVLGPLPADIVAAFETPSRRIIQMFGMTEGLCLVTPTASPPEIRHHTVGTPISPLDEVRVYAPGTEDSVPPGTQGELCTRGPYTVRGYFRAPERNAEAFTSDGFYRSGDIVVEVPENGLSFYRFEDRIKDLINRGGEKVNAAEIENLLVRHPAVERAAVVAMPDERLGERCCAFIVPKFGAQAPQLGEVQRFLDEIGVAKFKWPERIEACEELPLTNVSKIDKRALRVRITDILAAERPR
ncbi:AMP-binding protein (plasmid) [Streptomyces sp. NBC_01450]|uniref:(2,3-dihydroxybenzoyl)adenylate synthase n=1 Tax=Streptomyces sp. NBC_01450 TaxID=2903871 RepID=UPI002E2EF588|nr:AMP-binding protein [Streptomyces sp. NBC_01450]